MHRLLIPLLALASCQEFGLDFGDDPTEEPLGLRLELEPESHAFRAVCQQEEVTVRLVNAGDERLRITRVRYNATSGAMRMTHQIPLADPYPLEPGESAPVLITHRPRVPEFAEGFLEVDSNDPRGRLVASQVSEIDVLDRSESFVRDQPEVDVIVVVDTTGSMESLHDEGTIVGGLDRLVSELSNVTSAWKIGSVWGADGCMKGVVDADTDDPAGTLAASFPPPEALQNDTLMFLADEALVETGPGGCNGQFLREGAALHVVLLGNSVPEVGRSWDDTAPRWASYVEDCRLLRVHAMVNSVDFPGTDRPNPYLDAANGTGGVIVNATASGPSWPAKWSAVGSAIGQQIGFLPLEGVPDPATLEVLVDGATWDSGWSLDDERGTVRLVRPVADGTEVEVRYELASCLPLECELLP